MNSDIQPTQSQHDEHNQNNTSDIVQQAFAPDDKPVDTSFAPKPLPKKKFSLKHLSKKQKLVAILLVILLLGGFALWWFVLKPKPVAPSAAPIVQEPVSEEKPIVSNVTGLPVNEEVNKRNVTGVMIENSPDARPQAGLKDADIVFEAVAEGGITRFLALFHDDEPNYVGPVRSARPYYLHWVQPFNAALAHVGGSPEALGQIKVFRVRDLDQFSNPGAYQRISSRYAPHNMYTGIDKLNQLEKDKKFTPDSFKSFVRKDKATPGSAVKAGKINFTLSSFLYNPSFEYSKKENTYGRSQGGKKHVDDKSGKQIAPNVVIALIMRKGANGKYSTYNTRGSGSMLVFQDGQVIKGTWKKKSLNAQFDFVSKTGEPLKLNPGKTWITVVGSSGEVKYKP